MNKKTKEPPEAIDYIFQKAIDVYAGRDNKKNAIAQIYNKYGTNKNSGGMYIRIIFSMLDGGTYIYGPNEMATDRLLKNISAALGQNYLKNALIAVEGHLKAKNAPKKSKKWEIFNKWKLYNERQLDEIDSPINIHHDIEDIQNDTNLSDTEKSSLIKSRIGQGQFRKNVINVWGIGEVCPVTKTKIKELLIASHIKSWRSCKTKEERLDGANGILLCSHLDKLFDNYLISFRKEKHNYKLKVSDKIDKKELAKIGIADNLSLDTTKIKKRYLPKFESYISGHYKIFSAIKGNCKA